MPCRIPNPIFVEYFRYRGSANIQSQISIPNNWTVNSGTFSILSEHQLDISAVGEMEYSGTSLQQLKTRDTTSSSNYSFQLFFVGQENLIVSLIARKEGLNSYVTLTLNFEDNTISFGDITSPNVTSYNLSSGKYYKIDLWVFSNSAYAYINDYLIGTETISFNSHDCSISVDQLPSSGIAVLKGFRVFELIESAVAGVANNSDLILQDRIDLIAEINNPSSLTWDYFKALDKKYQSIKGRRVTEDGWKSLGYELKPPTTEEFFND